MKCLDEQCDRIWNMLVPDAPKFFKDYKLLDAVNTAENCATILRVAQTRGCLHDDFHIWAAAGSGTLAHMAYRHILHLMVQSFINLDVDPYAEHPLIDFSRD